MNILLLNRNYILVEYKITRCCLGCRFGSGLSHDGWGTGKIGCLEAGVGKGLVTMALGTV